MDMDGQQNEESPNKFLEYLNRQSDWLEETKGNIMIVATVIAGMSFQVMANPPGGVWQSDNCSGNQSVNAPICKGKAGTAVLEYEGSKRRLYLGMVISSTVSFTASMSLILLVISGLQLRNRMVMAMLITFMASAVLCISAAFFFTVALVQSDDQIIHYILMIYLGFWVVFPVITLLSQIVWLLGWSLWCIACCCALRRPPTPPFLCILSLLIK